MADARGEASSNEQTDEQTDEPNDEPSAVDAPQYFQTTQDDTTPQSPTTDQTHTHRTLDDQPAAHAAATAADAAAAPADHAASSAAADAMPPPDADTSAAFARAAELLDRDDDLELPPMEKLSSSDCDGLLTSTPRAARKAVGVKHSLDAKARYRGVPLPSLSQLAAADPPVPPPPPRERPHFALKQQQSTDERNREALEALEAAMPKLDEAEAALVARAKYMLEHIEPMRFEPPRRAASARRPRRKSPASSSAAAADATKAKAASSTQEAAPAAVEESIRQMQQLPEAKPVTAPPSSTRGSSLRSSATPSSISSEYQELTRARLRRHKEQREEAARAEKARADAERVTKAEVERERLARFQAEVAHRAKMYGRKLVAERRGEQLRTKEEAAAQAERRAKQLAEADAKRDRTLRDIARRRAEEREAAAQAQAAAQRERARKAEDSERKALALQAAARRNVRESAMREAEATAADEAERRQQAALYASPQHVMQREARAEAERRRAEGRLRHRRTMLSDPMHDDDDGYLGINYPDESAGRARGPVVDADGRSESGVSPRRGNPFHPGTFPRRTAAQHKVIDGAQVLKIVQQSEPASSPPASPVGSPSPSRAAKWIAKPLDTSKGWDASVAPFWALECGVVRPKDTARSTVALPPSARARRPGYQDFVPSMGASQQEQYSPQRMRHALPQHVHSPRRISRQAHDEGDDFDESEASGFLMSPDFESEELELHLSSELEELQRLRGESEVEVEEAYNDSDEWPVFGDLDEAALEAAAFETTSDLAVSLGQNPWELNPWKGSEQAPLGSERAQRGGEPTHLRPSREAPPRGRLDGSASSAMGGPASRTPSSSVGSERSSRTPVDGYSERKRRSTRAIWRRPPVPLDRVVDSMDVAAAIQSR